MKVSNAVEEDVENYEKEQNLQDSEVFDSESFISNAFPVSKVRNMDSLIEHVRQQFFCADPVTYHKLLRQIRTSKSKRADRAYVTGMYLNDSHIKICQMCKQPSSQVYVTEIANYGIELPQMNLCLCPTCAGKYKSLRDKNKEKFKDAMKVAICSLNIDENSEEYEIQLGADLSLYFTETHVAEIQTILGLLSEYGVPIMNQDEEKIEEFLEDRKIHVPAPTLEQPYDEIVIEQEINDDSEIEENMEETKLGAFQTDENNDSEFDFLTSSEPIQDGNLVSYKKMQTLEIVDAVMDSNKYPLHKAFLGKRVGDLVVMNGRRYLIISVL